MKNRLKELRALCDLSQQGLADAVGLPLETINEIETGQRTPDISLAWELADYFGLRIEDVFLYQPGVDEEA